MDQWVLEIGTFEINFVQCWVPADFLKRLLHNGPKNKIKCNHKMGVQSCTKSTIKWEKSTFSESFSSLLNTHVPSALGNFFPEKTPLVFKSFFSTFLHLISPLV